MSLKTIFLLIFLSLFLYADSIESYKINSMIKKDGTVFQTENIVYSIQNQNSPYGIYRFIPLNDFAALKDITLLIDGKKESIERGKGRGYFYIRIAHAKTLKNGLHYFELRYKLTLKDREHIVIFPIGTEFKAPIKHSSIDITLSHKFKDSKIYVYTGHANHLTHQAKIEKISSTKYLIKVDNLKANNGVTVSFYPKDPPIFISKNQLYTYWFVSIFSFVLIFYWYKFKRGRKIVVDDLSYDVPKGLDILESSLLIDLTPNSHTTLASAILELATKGYLEIKITKNINNNQAQYFSITPLKKLVDYIFKANMEIHKIKKDTSKLSESLQLLYEILFRESDIFVVRKMDLKFSRNFRKSLKELYEKMVDSCIDKGLFTQRPKKLKFQFISLSLLIQMPFIIYMAYQTYILGGLEALMNGVVFFAIFSFVFYMSFRMIMTKNIFIIIFIPVLLYFTFNILQAMLDDVLFYYPFPLVLLPIIPTLLLANYIEVYTNKGFETVKELLKLKNFIIHSNASQIYSYLKKSQSIDTILPYIAYFDDFDRWIEYYPNIDETQFAWYDGKKDQLKYLHKTLANGLRETIRYGTYHGVPYGVVN
ncbi:Putative membrane protein precursor [hydrothermal vent metagenome]|uniref:Putative membrane protein n=1 Tax=hydrothermal vent metagenome TaxID=652676 RepID=A0A1W1BEB8_9ZZZZ